MDIGTRHARRLLAAYRKHGVRYHARAHTRA